MKHFLLLVLIFQTAAAFSQPPQYFVPGTKWRIDQIYTDGMNDCYYHQDYVMEYNGHDTLIGSETYNVLHCHGTLTFYPSQQCQQVLNETVSYDKIVRQDGRKIIFHDFSGSDTTIYDFDLAIGDTIPVTEYVNPNPSSGGCDRIVSGIDSILVEGFYRRIFHLENGYDYMEGIGTTRGFIDYRENLECPFENISELRCFQVNGTNYYSPEGSSDCVFDLGIDTFEKIDVSVFPNPASDRLNLSFGKDVQISDVQLIDLQGRRQKAAMLTDFTCDISSLASGIYILRIRTSDGRSGETKFVK